MSQTKPQTKTVSKETFERFVFLQKYYEPKISEVLMVLFLLVVCATVASYMFPEDDLSSIQGLIPGLAYFLFCSIRLGYAFNYYWHFRTDNSLSSGMKVACRQTGAHVLVD